MIAVPAPAPMLTCLAGWILIVVCLPDSNGNSLNSPNLSCSFVVFPSAQVIS